MENSIHIALNTFPLLEVNRLRDQNMNFNLYFLICSKASFPHDYSYRNVFEEFLKRIYNHLP